MADVGELLTTDGVVLFVFIGREINPSHCDGPLPSHLILLENMRAESERRSVPIDSLPV